MTERTRFDHYLTVEDLAAEMTRCQCKGKGAVYVRVPVGHRFYGKAIPCRCQTDAVAAQRAHRLLSRSGLTTTAMDRWSFDSFQPWACVHPETMQPDEGIEQSMRQIANACWEYAKDPRGWLVLVGVYGCGKTHLAVAVLNKLILAEIPSFFSSVSRLLDTLRSSYNDGSYDAYLNFVQTTGVLIIDDLGTERPTDWTAETLTQIIDYRYTNRLPVVVTTNEHPSKRSRTSRLWSRMTEGADQRDGWVTILDIPAGDYRHRAKTVKREAR